MGIKNLPPMLFFACLKITSSTDEIEEFATRSRQKEYFGMDDSDIQAVYRVEEHDIVFDQAEKVYFRVINTESLTDTAAENRIAGYFRIEKVR